MNTTWGETGAPHARTVIPQLTARGLPVDMSSEAFGLLRDSTDIADDAWALRSRMHEEGYLYMPGYLDRAEVTEVRTELLDKCAASGLLDDRVGRSQGIARPNGTRYFMPDLAVDNPSLSKLLYADNGRVMKLYEGLLEGEVRHFDYT